MRNNFCACCAVAGIVLGGCHKGDPIHVVAAPPAPLDGGWILAQSRDGIVSVGVPPGWRTGADSPGDNLKELTANLGPSNSEAQASSDPTLNAQIQGMARQMEQDRKTMEDKAMAELEKKGIVINVINGSKPTPGEQRTRFYVNVTHDGGFVSLQDAIDVERNHYAFPPKPSAFLLPIGKAQKFSADDSLRDGMTLHQISYVIVDGGDTYTLRFVTEEGMESIQSVADAIANSLRIKPSKRG